MRGFIFLVLFSLSSFTFAQESATPISQECGLNEDGSIAIADGTLCKQDIAFGNIYEIFPSLVEELKPIWKLNFFQSVGDEPETQILLGDYHGDAVFFVLFKLFFYLVILVLVVYSLFLVIHAIIRVLKGESLMAADFSEDDTKSWSIGAIVAGLFLFPFKNFFIGQMMVFSLGILSLSLANLTSSVFYAGNQAVFNDYTNPVIVEEESVTNGVWERHSFMADSYYRYLTTMALCQEETASYKVTASHWSTTADDYRKRYACELGENENDKFLAHHWYDTNSTPPFAWYDTAYGADKGVGKYRFSSIKDIVFETAPTKTSYCKVEDNTLKSHACGGVTIYNANWANNPLITLLDEPVELFEIIDSMEKAINPAMDAESLKVVVATHWGELRTLLSTAFNETSAAAQLVEEDNHLVALDNEIMDKRSALNRIYEDSARPHYQNASKLLHQTAMNALLFGSKHEYEQIHSVRSGARKTGKLELRENGIASHFSNAQALAKWVRRAQCVDYPEDLVHTATTLSFLQGETPLLPSTASARCLDMDDESILEYVGNLGEQEEEAFRDNAIARFAQIEDSFADEWDNRVGLLTAQRRAIESSFSESVTEGTLNRWWVDARQKGYLGIATYLKNISQVVETYKNDVRQITNTYQFMQPNFNTKYVSFDVEEKSGSSVRFRAFSYAGDEVLNSTYPLFKKVDPLVSSAQWLMQREMLLRQKPLDNGNVDTDSFKIFEMIDLSKDYFDRLGISFSYKDNQQGLCLTDPTQCPFPLSDPLVELSLLGHDLVDAGIEFFSLALPIKYISGTVLKRNASSQEGAVVESKDIEKVKNAMGGLGAVIFGLVDIASVGVDLMYDLLGPLMVAVTIMGAALAYLLPIVPEVYLYMKFIAWFMVLVMASFSVLLWCLFIVRFKEKRDIIKSAGLHYGVEIMFSPTLATIATIFAYYFFYVVAFAVGSTSIFLSGLPLFESDSVIRNFFDTLFSLVLIFFIFIMGLRYVYQLMEDMMGELLTRLGVNHKAMDDKVGDFVKALLFDKARKLLDDAHKNHAKKGRREYRDQLAAKIQNAQHGMAEFNSMYGNAENGGRK